MRFRSRGRRRSFRGRSRRRGGMRRGRGRGVRIGYRM